MKNRRFYAELVHLLGFLPGKTDLYRLAFIPRSAIQDSKRKRKLNNERLEYLGDAILDAIVADYLFTLYPNADEGFMTKLRARIVKRKTLDQVASQMAIPAIIAMQGKNGPTSKHIYGNALEALLGAIYLDKGYKKTRKFFVRKVIEAHLDLAKLTRKDSDYKSRIIEWAQKNKIEVIFESTEEHKGEGNPSFVSVIRLANKPFGTGHGSSKKEAEQQAAKQALKDIDSKLK